MLLYECAGMARSVDQEIAADLSKEERAEMVAMLVKIASRLRPSLVSQPK